LSILLRTLTGVFFAIVLRIRIFLRVYGNTLLVLLFLPPPHCAAGTHFSPLSGLTNGGWTCVQTDSFPHLPPVIQLHTRSPFSPPTASCAFDCIIFSFLVLFSYKPVPCLVALFVHPNTVSLTDPFPSGCPQSDRYQDTSSDDRRERYLHSETPD
jgi:hypothetical protein